MGTAAGLVVVGLLIAFPGIVLLCFAYAYFLYWAGAPGGLAGAFGFAGLTFLVLIGDRRRHRPVLHQEDDRHEHDEEDCHRRHQHAPAR